MRFERTEERRQKAVGRSGPARLLSFFFCLLASVCCLLFAGCQSSHLAKPLAPKLAGNDPADQLEFWHALTDEAVASNDQAFHGVLLYLDGKDEASNYAE